MEKCRVMSVNTVERGKIVADLINKRNEVEKKLDTITSLLEDRKITVQEYNTLKQDYKERIEKLKKEIDRQCGIGDKTKIIKKSNSKKHKKRWWLLGALIIIIFLISLSSNAPMEEETFSQTPPTIPEHITTTTATNTAQSLGSIDKIVFYHGYGYQDYEIYAMDIYGSQWIRLTNDAFFESSPSCSPGGAKIAFMRDNNTDWGIWIMNFNGSDQILLTSDNKTSTYWSPAWSPDGLKIAYTRNTENESSEIFIMNIDSTNKIQLTNNSVDDRNPSWSPDAKRIVFSRDRLNDSSLYVMTSDGSNQTQLIDNLGASDSDPDWSPDGQHITFTSNLDGDNEIYVIKADGSEIRKLTDNDAQDSEPAWSPDGNKIAFVSNRDGNSEIYIMNSDGSDETRITFHDAGEWGPDWIRLSEPTNIESLPIARPFSVEKTERDIKQGLEHQSRINIVPDYYTAKYRVNIRYNASLASDAESTKYGIWTDFNNVFKKLYTSQYKDDLETIFIAADLPITDIYGHEQTVFTMKIELTRTTAEKINWQNFQIRSIPEVADVYRTDPVFEDASN